MERLVHQALRAINSARTLVRPVISASTYRLYSDSTSAPSAPSATSSSSASSGRTSSAVVQDAAGKKAPAIKLDLSPPKGTRDFYSEKHRLKNWLFAKWRRIGDLYGFEEYDAPVLENEELYIRKAGEEITSQLYNFEEKGGRRLALRPEMTPSLARMSMGITAEDVGIKINSRKILNALMASLNIPEERWVAACVLVDKLDKVPLSAVADDLAALDISIEVAETLVDALKVKNIDEFATRLGADSPGVADIKGELRAICGGGRYDSLLSSLSSAEVVPAVGFGFGNAVVYELLKAKNLLPQLEVEGEGRADVLVYPMEENFRGQAVKTATTLRQAGVRVDIILDARKPKWVFQRADKIRAPVVVMLAGDEHGRGEAIMRDMRGRE
ncbi:hypothetical protein B484DRAFT_413186 [Ochromonadaceae sp. CCMP2298]|nr:hypothetical protein B484DRAFT_413186 [Ochromonadaceae sp. CCMP2298]